MSLLSKLRGFARDGVPITWLLPLLLGSFVALAVIPVAVIGYLGAHWNTDRLLRDRHEMLLREAVDTVAAPLEAISIQLGHIAHFASSKGLSAGRDLQGLVFALVSSTPVLGVIDYVAADGSGLRFMREKHAPIAMPSGRLPGDALAEAAAATRSAWSNPVWDPHFGEAVVRLHVPIAGVGGMAGAIRATVRASDLSTHMRDRIVSPQHVPFVLVDTEQVFAHPAFAARPGSPAPAGAVPRLDDLGDTVLGGIWKRERNALPAFVTLPGAAAHWSWISFSGGATFLYDVRRDIGALPWTIGLHFTSDETRPERWTVLAIAGIGALIFVLAILFAVYAGRRLARPLVALTQTARKISNFEFDTSALAGGTARVRELNDAFQALEKMSMGLTWFGRYVPQTLVRRLMTADGADADHDVGGLREISIMFTDLEGYTAFSASCSAAEAAAYLNQLLELVGPVIETSGGTIDKYIGDGIMAFWGAPDRRHDHAAAACTAALAVSKAVKTVNGRRRAGGEPVCPIRIGIHTGTVVVGNIGFQGRMNYTIIGQAVNVAQRLEQAGRTCRGEDESVILVSDATRAAAGQPDFRFTEVEVDADIPKPVFRLD